ncbi:hypothetical protein DERF_002542 [Dermatophagoides farinae]|uniref:Uncharacterized protein n=1 Tax=Dermatophagoides farinae TaxID=6954 RepID=A0A922IBT1_DERFA|nr:hypothetical protein DERF_002542 [Dermatophagoides farinae]
MNIESSSSSLPFDYLMIDSFVLGFPRGRGGRMKYSFTLVKNLRMEDMSLYVILEKGKKCDALKA